MPDYLVRRDGVWHFVRRVPKDLAALDTRGIVKQSTKIVVARDPKGTRARRAAKGLNGALEAYWRGLIEGRATEARSRYDAARRRARIFGVEYKSAADLATTPVLEILQRVEILLDKKAVDDEASVAAVLGGEAKPSILLSDLYSTWESLTREERTGMSPDQLRKLLSQKRRSAASLISVVGEKPIDQLTRSDGLDFREYWQNRVVAEACDPRTANKSIGDIKRMVRVVDRGLRLGLQPIFSDLRLAENDEESRPPFPPEFVQQQILRNRALAGLNDQARAIIYVMVETGMRPSEIVNLNKNTIHTMADVPHVQVRPDGRKMKTAPSKRDIPLVGCALVALRAHPNGFPRYHDASSGLSATVNKFLLENNLRPTRDHTLYSLRHTFKDRLRAVEAPEELVDELMGHSNPKPRYGAGHRLQQKAEWLQRIAFTPPSTV